MAAYVRKVNQTLSTIASTGDQFYPFGLSNWNDEQVSSKFHNIYNAPELSNATWLFSLGTSLFLVDTFTIELHREDCSFSPLYLQHPPHLTIRQPRLSWLAHRSTRPCSAQPQRPPRTLPRRALHLRNKCRSRHCSRYVRALLRARAAPSES